MRSPTAILLALIIALVATQHQQPVHAQSAATTTATGGTTISAPASGPTTAAGGGGGSGATTLSPSDSGLIATPAPSTDTLLTMGDLIFVNPIQSTGIFFMIIFFSTGLEYIFEVLDNQRNAYLRNIILSTKEELAAVAFSQMVLIFLSLIVGFSSVARAVVLLATLMIVFMCLNFAIYVVIVNLLQSRRALEWSTFEWARLDLDALHTKQEALFKAARSVFLRRSKVGARVRSCLSDGREGPTSIMPVLFASYVGHVERTYLKESFDFTWVTWTALIGIVIADGLRSISVNSTSDSGSVASTQILTFVFVIGWGLMFCLLGARYVQQRRLMSYVSQWNLSGSFADVTAGSVSTRNSNANSTGSNKNNNSNNNSRYQELDTGDDADRKAPKTDEELAEGLLENFFFNSVGGALSVFQVFMLGLLWFSCVFVVGMVHLSWVTFGWVALFIYVAAAVPFFVATTVILPSALSDIFIVASISVDFDDELITKSVNGQYDLRQVEQSDDDDEDENDAAAAGGPNQGGNSGGASPDSAQRTRRFVPGMDLDRALLETDGGGGHCDDEIDAPIEQVSLGIGATGAAPMRVQGVPPARPGTFVWAPRRPVFHSALGSQEL